MNRRAFLASLCAVVAAPFVPVKPVSLGFGAIVVSDPETGIALRLVQSFNADLQRQMNVLQSQYADTLGLSLGHPSRRKHDPS